MDRRVKERLVGASILVVLLVLIVPELLSGPQPAVPRAPVPSQPANTPEAVRNVTVDLATSKSPAPDLGLAPEAPSIAASSAAPAPDMAAPASPQPPASAPMVSTLPAAAPAVPIESPPPAPTSAGVASKPPSAGHAWAVQLGSFASRANAEKLVRQLKAQGYSVYLVSSGSKRALRYRVRIGPLSDRAAAVQAIAKLKVSGHAASVVAPSP